MRRALALAMTFLAACGGAPPRVVAPAPHARSAAPPASQAAPAAAPVDTRPPLWAIALPGWEPLYLAVDGAGNAYVAGACVGDPGEWCREDQTSFVASFDENGHTRWRTELGPDGGTVIGLAFATGGALGIVLEQDAGHTATATNSNGAQCAPIHFDGAGARLTDAVARLDPSTGAVLGAVVPHPPAALPPQRRPRPQPRARGHSPRVFVIDEIFIRSQHGFPTLVPDPAGPGWLALLLGAVSRVDATPAFIEDRLADPVRTRYALGRIDSRLVTMALDDTALVGTPTPTPATALTAHVSDDRLDVVVQPADVAAARDSLEDEAQLVTTDDGVLVLGQYARNALTCGVQHLDAPASPLQPDGFIASIGADGTCRWLRAIATSGPDAADAGVALADGSLLVAAVRGGEDGPANAQIVLMHLGPDGAPLGERVLGVAGPERGPRAIAVLPDGDVLVLAHTDRASRTGDVDVPRGVTLMRTRVP